MFLTKQSITHTTSITCTYGSISALPEQEVDMALNKPVTCCRLGSSYKKDPKMAAKINDNGEYFPVNTVMRRITSFWSTLNHIYDGGPKRL